MQQQENKRGGGGGGRVDGNRGAGDNYVNDEVELATKSLRVQNKRFYVDVKQNSRGKFLKITEVGVWNRKSRILLSMSCASELRDRLTELGDMCAKLPPNEKAATRERGVPAKTASEAAPPAAPAGADKGSAPGRRANQAGAGGEAPQQPQQQQQRSQQQQQQPPPFVEDRIHSETIVRETRRYTLDLKENFRGRFLRITMYTQMQRAQVAIPEQGIIEMRNTLEAFVAEFASPEDLQEESGNNDIKRASLESQNMRVDGRTFYFDVTSNRRGILLRVSEVHASYRTAITVPDRSWAKFRDILNGYVEKLEEVHEADKGAADDPKEGANAVPAVGQKEGANKGPSGAQKEATPNKGGSSSAQKEGAASKGPVVAQKDGASAATANKGSNAASKSDAVSKSGGAEKPAASAAKPAGEKAAVASNGTTKPERAAAAEVK